MKHFVNLILFISIFIISLNVSWQVSSIFNFYYSPLYSILKIDKHIKKYSVRNYNKNKRNFAQTTPNEHKRLFKEIVKSINNNGKGLDNIKYELPNGKRYLLLTSVEVKHLNDVSKLVKLFNGITSFLIIVLIFLILLSKKLKIKLYSQKEYLTMLLLTTISTTCIIIMIGPLKIFYALHKLIFTSNKWFFYYEESLMTTLMKAPDIFGYIAIFMVILFIISFILLTKLMYKFVK